MCWYLHGRMILIENENNTQTFNQGYLFGAGLAAAIKDIIPGLANVAEGVLQSNENSPLNLDSYISNTRCIPQDDLRGDATMAYKINRSIEVNGTKKWVRANSEQEYFEKLCQLIGAPATREEQVKHPFSDYAKRWYDTFSKPTVSTVTAITYKRQLDHLKRKFAQKAIEDITTQDIQELFNEMGDCTKETKNKLKTVLRMILDNAVDDGYIQKNPILSRRLKISGKKSTETKPYSVDQMRYLVNHIGDINSAQDRAYMALQALHPLRLEEVLGLRWCDIDLQDDTLHIRQVVTHPDRNQPEVKAPKTDKSARELPLSAECKKYLQPGNPDHFVIGGAKPLSYTQVRRMCNRIAKEIGFEESITPIRFRTTVLTDIYELTKDIKLTQAAAGHTTSDMTLKYYVKGRGDKSASQSSLTQLYAGIQ